jgi:two-component system nitrogen regulation sensor histidine kinase GlnL
MGRMAAELLHASQRIVGTELLDALVTSVFLLDQDLQVSYLNAAAQTLLGLSPNQALGRRITDLTRGAETLLPLFERARLGGEAVVHRELAWPAPGSVDRILDCAVTQITMGPGPSAPAAGNRGHHSAPRLTRENALLAQLGGSRLMVRQLAHEIKNPLGGVRGAAQLLERELLDPALREYTRVIISEADRLTNLLDSMLGPGRPPAKQLTNLHELLERVYHLLRSEAPEGVTVDRDYDPSLPPLTVDPNHIIQAMLNLGRNAMQALSAGGNVHAPRRGCCAPAPRAMSASARAAIAWSPPSNSKTTARACPRIFATPFFIRWSPGAPTAPGLGLGIAQDLVSRHGGLIEFDSAPGRTIFVISLPMDSV